MPKTSLTKGRPGKSHSLDEPDLPAVLTCALHAHPVLQEGISKDLPIEHQEMDVAHAPN